MRNILYTKEFEYHLPEEMIAQTPVEPRDSSRLLVINKNTHEVHARQFTDVLDYFDKGDVLILNNTKVISARLPARRNGGGKSEIFLLKDIGNYKWEALVKPGSKIPVGAELTIGNIRVKVVDITSDGGRIIQFDSEEDVRRAINVFGKIPLPPYIKKEISDPSRYQTIYAEVEGSVAAPTAALHFTPSILESLKDKGVTIAFTTLHMGLGSFRPIKEEVLSDHTMPVEYVQVSEEVAEIVNQAKKENRKVAGCGTDVVRTLESAAVEVGKIRSFNGTTNLYITPGYKFKIVDKFITNLHLPRSSHLVLVSSFAGIEIIREAYRLAIEEKFRFYTFGDATLML